MIPTAEGQVMTMWPLPSGAYASIDAFALFQQQGPDVGFCDVYSSASDAECALALTSALKSGTFQAATPGFPTQPLSISITAALIVQQPGMDCGNFSFPPYPAVSPNAIAGQFSFTDPTTGQAASVQFSENVADLMMRKVYPESGDTKGGTQLGVTVGQNGSGGYWVRFNWQAVPAAPAAATPATSGTNMLDVLAPGAAAAAAK
jgi:hypothetical protein